MAAQTIDIHSLFSQLDDAERFDTFDKLVTRLGLSPVEIELTFGVCYESARRWSLGLTTPPLAVVIALSAIESLDPEERDAFIARRKIVLADNSKAVSQRARNAAKREEYSAPGLSAKQAGMIASRGAA